MPHKNILASGQTALAVVDVQEAFRRAIPEFALIATRIAKAVRGFRMLDIPVLVTEQYPKGLGHTAPEIMTALPDDLEVIEKTAFSSCGAEPFISKLTELGVKQVVLCGLETHICVNQTAHDLLDRGFQVHLLLDCVGSRFEHDERAGVDKMMASGVLSSSVEMALFEIMGGAKHAKFKEIQGLIR